MTFYTPIDKTPKPGSHRVYYNEATKRRVIVPYHKRDLPKGTLMSILKAAGIDERTGRQKT